jgi:hypothetical protein
MYLAITKELFWSGTIDIVGCMRAPYLVLNDVEETGFDTLFRRAQDDDQLV